ncbi:MAG: WecB/TagA/CpsF family glycosyltransferase [Planifilum sp.]|jgi:N-acetylglucosaminyldiphosphoundecaprenol N-acetyl-beta-D-mannosaminyltransferase
MEKIEIRGVVFDSVSMAEATKRCKDWLTEPDRTTPAVIHTPNAEIVQLCIEQPEIRRLVNSADLIVPDGSGVILASKILGKPLKKGKVAGVELSERIVELCAELGLGVFILGGRPGVPEAAADRLCEKYPGLIISGVRNGYFDDDADVIDEINRSGAAFLIVCLGVPKQEKWIAAHKRELRVKLTGGFGGSVDIFAGTAKRAPKIFIKLGLEWFYRLCREPKRIGRMMKLPKFVFGTIAVRLRGGHKSAK